MNAEQVAKDRIVWAIIAMVVTDLTLAVADAIIKATLTVMPLAQFVFLRSCLTLPILLAVLKLALPHVSLMPARPGWALLRSTLLLASLLVYYLSLPRLAFSMAAACYYTIPLFVTLFALLLGGEPVGRRGWLAVATGFAGVLLMLRPQVGDLNASIFLPLVSAVLYALGMILTRTKSQAENPFVLALVFNAIGIALGGTGGLFSLWGDAAEAGTWVPITLNTGALMLLLTVMMLVGSVGTAVAYQWGPSSTISTWDFSYLVFATVIGVTVFSEVLDPISGIGVALILAAGIASVRKPAAAP